MKIRKEDKAGIYFTVIIHVAVVIVLLISQIGVIATKENSFVLDFSKQEKAEREAREQEFREQISRRLDELISNYEAPHSSGEIKNIAVNAGLKDDRGTDAEKLYEDAEKIARELKSGSKPAVEEDMRDEAVDMSRDRQNRDKGMEYTGPSVVSYSLDGRKASRLKIPAYRCYGGGDVTVIIKVNNQGDVVNAEILDAVSSGDQCLRDFAIRAARLSKFSASQSAPPRQTGEIVYRFIAQ